MYFYVKMTEINLIDLEKDWKWRKSKNLFLSDLVGEYFQETNREWNIDDINEFLNSFVSIKGSIIDNLNEADAEKALQQLDKRIVATREIINDIEKIPEEVVKIVEDLYSREEIPFDLDSCIYSNWAFRAKATKDFRHHKKSDPDYWTAINMQFAANQVAYLIGWMEYNAIGRLKEYVDKCEALKLFIWENRSRFVKYAPKNDDYYIEWSILNAKTLAKSTGKGVFTTMVFKLVNNKWEIFNYNQMTLYDEEWFKFRSIPRSLIHQ